MDMKATEREAGVAHVRAALLGGYGTVLEEWGAWTGETFLVGDDLSYTTPPRLLPTVPDFLYCARRSSKIRCTSS